MAFAKFKPTVKSAPFREGDAVIALGYAHDGMGVQQAVEGIIWNPAPPIKGKRAYWIADGNRYWHAPAADIAAAYEMEAAA